MAEELDMHSSSVSTQKDTSLLPVPETKFEGSEGERFRWSEKWQMLLHFGKCKCLHTASGNTGVNYEMGGTILSKTVKGKDLG